MNAILERLNSAGAWFVEFAVPMLVQSGVLILILLLVDLALRKRVRAVFRYWIWLLVLAKLVLPSSLSSPLSLGYFLGDELAEIKISEAGIQEEPFDWRMIRPVPPLKVPAGYDIGAGTTTDAGRPISPVESGVAEEFPKIVTSPMTRVPVTWQGAIFLVWAAVVAAMGLLLLQRAMFVRGLVAQAKEPNRLMKETLEFCCGQMAVKAKVRLKVSASATSPAVCGLFRPVILVPANLGRRLGSRDLRAVLLHELAHIKRGDLWVNLAQTVLQIVYFYNPLLWFANAMIRRVREQAVDEMVLVAMGERAKSYPETLVNVAKLAFKQPMLSLRLIGVVESKNALAGRIKRILSRPIPKSAKLGVLGLIIVLAIGCGLLPMAKVEKTATEVEVEGQSSRSNLIEKLQTAIVGGDISKVEKLIGEGVSVNMPGKEGKTPLRWAVDAGHKEIVELLIRNGANVNTPDDYGNTPLHITGTKPQADTAKYLDIAGILIANGADVNAKARSNRTPLHFCAKYGNKDIVELLIASGANIDLKDDFGKTPLLFAECIHKGVSEALINNGADVTAKDKYGQTPLHLAANWGHVDIVKLFLDKEAEVNAKDNNGLTPLDYATKKNYRDAMKLLVANGGYSAYKLENFELKRVFLPDVDDKAVMLDLASGQLVDIPEPVTGTEVLAEIDKLDKGDITYDARNLIFVRGTTSNKSDVQAGPELVKVYEIIDGWHLPERMIVTTRSGEQYELSIIGANKKGCRINYYHLVKAAEPVEGANGESRKFGAVEFEGDKYNLMVRGGKGRVEALDPNAANLIRRYLRALEKSDWKTALSMCSISVMDKAQQYPTHESFFNTVVPVKEILNKLRDPCIGYGTRPPKYFAYIFDVRISKPDMPRNVSWQWKARKLEGRANWEIDFPAIPFETWIANEKQVIIRAVKEKEQLIKELAPRLKGVRTLLAAEREEFVVGEPIYFRLRIINQGDSILSYDCQQVAVDNSMTIEGPDGKEIKYTAEYFQTLGSPVLFKPGETKTLFDQFDITKQYDIRQPGQYRVQYNGKGLWFVLGKEDPPDLNDPRSCKYLPGILPSNVVIITIRSGIKQETLDVGKDAVEGEKAVSQTNTEDKPDVPVEEKKVLPVGDYALEFDGIDDFLEIHAGKSLQLGRHFTIQMWIKPEFPDTSTPDKDRNLLSKGGHILWAPDEKGNRKAGSYGFGFQLRPKDDSMVALDMSTANGAIYTSTNIFSYESGWKHLAISSRENSGVSRGINYVCNSQKAYKPAPNSNLIIGGKFLIPMGNPFKGQIAELRIWNRALSLDEIAEFKTITLNGSEPNLVGCWNFEKTEGRRAIDISPYKNHARLGSTYGVDNSDPAWVRVGTERENKEKTDVQVEGVGSVKAKNLVWGEDVDGLRTAVEFVPEKKCYSLGEEIGIRFHIQNVSDSTIHFTTASWRNDKTDCVIRDSFGKKCEVNGALYLGWNPLVRKTLNPGQIVILESASLAIARNRTDSIKHPAGHMVFLGPGQYSLNYELLFPNISYYTSRTGTHRLVQPGDWEGILVTGTRKLCVKPTSATSEKANVGVEVFSSNSLYQKQGSIRYALEFIGMPEELIDTTFVSKRGQLANPQQLEFANKLFSVRKSKDVDMFISLLSDGTKKQLNDDNNKRMLHHHIKEVKDGTFLYGEYDFKFFVTFRKVTEKLSEMLKKHVSFAETPSHAIHYWHFHKPNYMLIGESYYLIEDEGSYKIVTQTLLSEPVIPVKKEQPTGPKEYGIVAFKQTDNAYTQPTVWKYEWNIEIERNVADENTFQLLKTTKVISGNADLHPEIAVQKIIDESVIEKYKYKGLKYTFRIGDSEPRYNYHKYGRKLTSWSCGFSIANMGQSKSIFFPGKDITNIKTNKQGNFIGSDLELLSFETSEENIRYEHKVILRKSDSPEAKSAALLRLEQMTRRRISNKKLQYLNRILTTYANDHNSEYPDRLEQIKPYDTDEWLDWLLENIEYLGKGKTLTETSNTVLAYDKTLLGKAGSTNVLFNDGPVQYCNPDWLKKLGIAGEPAGHEISVIGRVLDRPGGKGVAAVKVKLWSDWTRQSWFALTNEKGNYRFDDIEPGPYILRVVDPSAGVWTEGVAVLVTPDPQRRRPQKTKLIRLAREGDRIVEVGTGPGQYRVSERRDRDTFEAIVITSDKQQQQRVDLYQQLPQGISGTVRNKDTGQPVAGATVNFLAIDRLRRSVRTDSEGRYRLYVPPRTIPLHCEGTAEQFCPVEMGDRHIRVGQGEHVENIDFLVRSAPSFTGQVVFGDGSKAPEGVEVRAYLHWRDKRPREGAIIGCMMAWTEVQYMKTDESGAFMGYFRVPDHLQDSENYEVLVTACARMPDASKGGARSVTTEAANPNVGEMKIVLEKTGSAEFRVVGPDGQGVTGLEVICEHWVKVNDGLRATVTEIGGGRYRAGRLIPGLEYRCWVQAKDYRQEYIRTIKPIVVRPGQHVQAPDIELEWWGKKVGIPYDLGRTGSDSTEAVPTLLEVLKKSTDKTAICRTAEALGQIGVASKPVIKALIDLLENKRGSAANAAAEALGHLGAVEAIGPIEAALNAGTIKHQIGTTALWRIKKAANAKPIAAVGSDEPAWGEAVEGLEFLAGIPEFRGLRLDMTQRQLRLHIKCHSLATLFQDTGGETSYHVYTGQGENVIVMFLNDQCIGIQRMRPDRQTALKLVEKEHSNEQKALPAYNETCLYLYEGGDRIEVAKRFRQVAQLAPAAEYGASARELAVLLERMAKERRPAIDAPNFDGDVSLNQHIADLIFDLRDVAVRADSIPGKCRVLRQMSIAPKSSQHNPAQRLRQLAEPANGGDIVQRLVQLLSDRRPTRSWAGALNGGHVLRYCDVALEILADVAKAKLPNETTTFDPRTGRDAYLGNADEKTRTEIIGRVNAWWAGQQALNAEASAEGFAKLPITWGEPADGLAVRLRPEKLKWHLGQTPELKVDVRNRGERQLHIVRHQATCQLWYGGQWYHWARELGLKSSPLDPRRQYNDIRISLDEYWVTKKGKPLRLRRGRHTVRVAFTAEPDDPKKGDAVRVLSNPVEIEIVPARAGEPKKKMNARDVVEAFVTAVVGGEDGKAAGFFHARSRVRNNVGHFRELFDGQKIRIVDVYADNKEALAVSGLTQGDDGRVIPGVTFVFEFVKEHGNWLIRDIDFGTQEEGQDQLAKFRRTRPAAKMIPQKADEPAWGEPVSGLQIRLRAKKTLWGIPEVPAFMLEAPAFMLDIRNDGTQIFSYVPIMFAHCQVEVDGQWYRWAAKGGGYSAGVRLLKHGMQVNSAITVKLVESWAEKDSGETLDLMPGVHTVRVRFVTGVPPLPPWVDTKSRVSAVSNPVEIEIVRQKSDVHPEAVSEPIFQGKTLTQYLEALKSSDTSIRREAVTAMQRMGPLPARVVPVLVEALQDESQYVRAGICYVLGTIGQEALSCVPRLILALEDEKWIVRNSAVAALGMIGDKRAIEPLIASLKDRQPMVRQSAADALGRLGDERALEPLTTALKDYNEQVRKAAAWAIEQVKPATQPQLEPGLWERLTAMASAADLIVVGIRDSHSSTRFEIKQMLKGSGHTGSIYLKQIDGMEMPLADETRQWIMFLRAEPDPRRLYPVAPTGWFLPYSRGLARKISEAVPLSQAWGSVAGGLRMGLRTRKSQLAADGPIPVEICIQNVSQKAITVYQHLMPGYGYHPYTRFSLVAPDGRRWELAKPVGPMTEGDFTPALTLSPGQTYTHTVRLKKWGVRREPLKPGEHFDLLVPGTYLITCTYSVPEKPDYIHPWKPPRNAWSGTLTSAPVEFELIPPAGTNDKPSWGEAVNGLRLRIKADGS